MVFPGRWVCARCWEHEKEKLSHYRPEETLRVPEGLDSQISWQSAREGFEPYAPADFIPRSHPWCSLRLKGHSAAGSIKEMKNPSDSIGNRTRHLPACSALPKPTAPLRTPLQIIPHINDLYNTKVCFIREVCSVDKEKLFFVCWEYGLFTKWPVGRKG
jgi:hypothetical protein